MDRNDWNRLLEESVVEIEHEDPRNVAAQRGQIKQHLQAAENRKGDDVVDHDSAPLKGLGLARESRNPVGGVLFELAVEVSKIFVGAVGGGGRLKLQRSNHERQDSS